MTTTNSYSNPRVDALLAGQISIGPMWTEADFAALCLAAADQAGMSVASQRKLAALLPDRRQDTAAPTDAEGLTSDTITDTQIRELRADYLGDGLYASFDGYQIRLYTDRGVVVHEVFLDESTLARFEAFVVELRARDAELPARAEGH